MTAASLRDLIVSVESGLITVAQNAQKLASEARNHGGYFPAIEVVRANGGSLSYAQEVHRKLLPGWSVTMHILDIHAGVKVFAHGRSDEHDDWVTNENAARAWLIAILRAKMKDAAE